MNLSKGYVGELLVKLLEAAASSIYGKENNFVGKDEALKQISQGVNGLYTASHYLPPPAEAVPAVNRMEGSFAKFEPWQQSYISEIMQINSQGADAVTSVTETVFKTQGVINLFNHEPATRRAVFYRGETNAAWTPVGRLGRNLPSSIRSAHDPYKTTSFEVEELAKFQSRVEADQELHRDIFGDRPALAPHNPDWWPIMQHYDDLVGTRMIDVTTSVFAALYFACAGWDGSVDEENDGALYLRPGGVGIGTETPRFRKGDYVDGGDGLLPSAQTYFDLPLGSNATVMRHRKADIKLDRVMAQDGYFLWNPHPWEPVDLDQHFKFRVYRGAKRHILRELYSMGYTARRIVRGRKGEQAHRSLCAVLGIQEYYG
jgi:hypothetical protein